MLINGVLLFKLDMILQWATPNFSCKAVDRTTTITTHIKGIRMIDRLTTAEFRYRRHCRLSQKDNQQAGKTKLGQQALNKTTEDFSHKIS